MRPKIVIGLLTGVAILAWNLWRAEKAEANGRPVADGG